jgi:ethylmalonyl-CoA/methylmalonyl-CoA decarboxylase
VSLGAARSTLAGLATVVPPAGGAITLDLGGPVARLRIEAGKAANAISVEMMVDLADAVDALARWRGAVVVVEAEPGAAFCAGGHLDQVRGALVDGDRGLSMAKAMTVVLDGLRDLPVVSIAAVDGPALGGGAELITAMDHVVVGPAARIRFVQTRLGIAPGWGGTRRLVERVGAADALRLLTTAEPVSPEAAVALGLADRVDPDPSRAARAWAEAISHSPAAAIRAAKAQVVAARPARPDDREAELFASVWGGEAHRAALASREPGGR